MCNILVAAFAIQKTLQIFTDSVWVNCFLPESLLVTGLLAAAGTQVISMTDAGLRIYSPIVYQNYVQKIMVIFVMVFVWNTSFLMGFLPQIGWNASHYSCSLFVFYSPSYLWLLCAVYLCYITCSGLIHVRLWHAIRHLRPLSERMETSSQLDKVESMVVTSRLYLFLNIICHLPCAVYIMVGASYYRDWITTSSGDRSYNELYLLPLLETAAICGLLLYGTNTPEIKAVLSQGCAALKSRSSSVRNAQQDVLPTITLSSATDQTIKARSLSTVTATSFLSQRNGFTCCHCGTFNHLHKYCSSASSLETLSSNGSEPRRSFSHGNIPCGRRATLSSLVIPEERPRVNRSTSLSSFDVSFTKEFTQATAWYPRVGSDSSRRDCHKNTNEELVNSGQLKNSLQSEVREMTLLKGPESYHNP